MAPLAQASVDRWFTAAFAAAQPQAIVPIVTMFQATESQGYAGCCAAMRDMDMRRTAALIAVPTLVIGGSQDPATPPPHSEALAKAIMGATLIMLPAAHLANVECSEAFGAAVTEYLMS